jgi:hypothetical protein
MHPVTKVLVQELHNVTQALLLNVQIFELCGRSSLVSRNRYRPQDSKARSHSAATQPAPEPLHEAHEALLFAMETAANSGTSHIESTSTSYVTSLASDIRRGVEENGRLYASYGKYKQMIPIDESEVRYPPATSCPSNDVIRTFSWIATTSNTASSPFFKKADFTSPQSPQHPTGSSTLERGPVSGPSILQINTSQPMSSAPTLLPSNQIM